MRFFNGACGADRRRGSSAGNTAQKSRPPERPGCIPTDDGGKGVMCRVPGSCRCICFRGHEVVRRSGPDPALRRRWDAVRTGFGKTVCPCVSPEKGAALSEEPWRNALRTYRPGLGLSAQCRCLPLRKAGRLPALSHEQDEGNGLVV